MRMEWDNCFLCLNDLTGQVSNEDEGEEDSCGNFTRKTELLISYLLSNKPSKHSGVISDIKQLFGRKEDGGSGVNFCEKCEGQLSRVAELHRELEVVQMKLVSVLKAVKMTVVQNARRGGGNGKERLEIFEQWVRVKEECNFEAKEGNEEGKSSLKTQRNILETLVAFQEAVIESDKDSIDIPLVFLERCFAYPPQPSEQFAPPLAVTVKTEEPEMEDFLDTPLSPSPPATVEDVNYDYEPESEAPKPKRKRRAPPTNADIKRVTSRPSRTCTSTARQKITEINNSSPEKEKQVPPSFPRKPPSQLKKVSGDIVKLLYSCAVCSFRSRSLYMLEEHLQNHKTEAASKEDAQPPPFPCDLCPDIKFHLEQSSSLHKLTHTGDYAILCEHCNCWENPMTFKDHMGTHLEKTFPCANCSYCASTRDQYIRHILEHHRNSSILACDMCGVRSSRKQKFLEHYFDVHQAIKKVVCGVDGCSKEFLNPKGLSCHKVTHTDKFRCSHCNKSYILQKDLDEHLLRVKGEKPWKCDQCVASFIEGRALRRHQVREHGLPPVKCDFCERTFRDPGQMSIHRRLHTGEGFSCDHPGCGKVFQTKSKLKEHQISHSTDRYFICDLCGIALKSKPHLRKHKATHVDEDAKKFKCPECGMAFLFHRYLVSHQRIHTGEKPFVCEACGKSFSHNPALHRHKKKCFLGPAPPVIQKRDERAKPIKLPKDK